MLSRPAGCCRTLSATFVARANRVNHTHPILVLQLAYVGWAKAEPRNRVRTFPDNETLRLFLRDGLQPLYLLERLNFSLYGNRITDDAIKDLGKARLRDRMLHCLAVWMGCFHRQFACSPWTWARTKQCIQSTWEIWCVPVTFRVWLSPSPQNQLTSLTLGAGSLLDGRGATRVKSTV